jgi:8-oxo-dGTP pyrophosphatase MutT (NUDIX family)
MAPVDERPIRRAASIVCARPGPDGFEVLVVERSRESRFLPGYVAFPGGAVDEADVTRAERWFRDGEQAARAAAIRELLEETGVALTSSGLVPAHGFVAIDDDPPSTDQLSPLCHWIAPPEVPVRFDARYFTAAVGRDAAVTPDAQEVVDAWWVSPRALLDGWSAGERKLYWPTWLTVTELAGCATVADVLALRFETRDPTPQEEASMPEHVMEQV